MKVDELIRYKLCNNCQSSPAIEIIFDRALVDNFEVADDGEVRDADGNVVLELGGNLITALREWDTGKLPGEYSIVSFCSLRCLREARDNLLQAEWEAMRAHMFDRHQPPR